MTLHVGSGAGLREHCGQVGAGKRGGSQPANSLRAIAYVSRRSKAAYIADQSCKECRNLKPRKEKSVAIMPLVRNPILPGFNADPSVLRVGNDGKISQCSAWVV